MCIRDREYRASSDIHLDHVIKPELRMQYTLVDEGVPLICDDMVLEIQRRVQKEPLWFSGYTKEDVYKRQGISH